MTEKPRNLSDLNMWLTLNSGTDLEKRKVTLNEMADGSLERVISPVTLYKVAEKTVEGCYLVNGGTKSWLCLDVSDLNVLFTPEYFAIFMVQESSVTINVYTYIASFRDSFNVRMALGCSVSDLNHTNAVAKLTAEEVAYCLEHETRKTGIKKLQQRARKLNMEV